MQLQWQITDLAGAPISETFIGTFLSAGTHGAAAMGETKQQGQVALVNNDSCTGQVQVSMFESFAGTLLKGAGKVCIKAFYGPHLVLWGILLIPSGDFDAKTVLCSLHDSTIRYKHRYLRYGDASVTAALHGGAGVPLDGLGVRTILTDAERPGGGTPDTGVVLTGVGSAVNTVYSQPDLIGGTTIPPEVDFTGDTTSGSPVVTGIPSTTGIQVNQLVADTVGGITENLYVLSVDSGTQITLTGNVTTGASGTALIAFEGLYVGVQRGDNIWDDVTGGFEVANGFELWFRPFDADHPSLGGTTWTAGDMCELITKPLMGDDRSQGNPDGNDPIVWVHGQGGVHIVYAPDANQLKNYAVQVRPGGQYDPLDLLGIALVHDFDSEDELGLWEDWQSAATLVSKAVLIDRAKAVVIGGAKPPGYCTITCDTDTPGGYQFMEDFFNGDIITIYAQEGSCEVIENVRLTSVTINQKDADGNVTLTVTAVPALVASGGLTVDA